MILIIQHHADHQLLFLVTELFHIVGCNGFRLMKTQRRFRGSSGDPSGKPLDAFQLDCLDLAYSPDLPQLSWEL